MSKQTAMQQLINEIVEHLTYDDDLTEDSRIALETIRLRCLGKLEMEKEQIMGAHKHGFSEGTVFGMSPLGYKYKSSEQYYNETYGK